MFGNPFKSLGSSKRKRGTINVDEADEFEELSQEKRVCLELIGLAYSLWCSFC